MYRRRARALLPLIVVACHAPLAPSDEPPQDDLIYEYGAKFEPPAGRVVHAMGQWTEYNAKYQALIPESLQPASQLVFIDLGDTPRGWNAAQIAAQVQAIDAQGRIPHLDIALRGLQPTPQELDQSQDKLYGIDDDVAYTSQYDGRILDLVAIAKAYGRPIMMRIGGEFSGAWNGYHPYAYPLAFRKIVQLFRAAGVDNVAFIWCYEPAAPGDFDQQNAAGEWRWYPGDDVVDWFGIDLFAAGDVGGPLSDRGFETAYARTIRFLDMAVAHGRPVIIAESSPSHYDFTTQAQAAWADWFAPYFQLIATRPEIKWFHYINYDWTKAGYYAAAGWKNNDLAASSTLAHMYITEIGKAKYLHRGELNLLRGY